MFTITSFVQEHWKALSLMVVLTLVAWLTATQTNLFRGDITTLTVGDSQIDVQEGFYDSDIGVFVPIVGNTGTFSASAVSVLDSGQYHLALRVLTTGIEAISVSGRLTVLDEYDVEISGTDVNAVTEYYAEGPLAILSDGAIAGDGSLRYEFTGAIFQPGDTEGSDTFNFGIDVELIPVDPDAPVDPNDPNTPGTPGIPVDPDPVPEPYCGDGVLQNPPEECEPPGSVLVVGGQLVTCDNNCKFVGAPFDLAGGDGGFCDDEHCLIVTKVAEHSITTAEGEWRKNIELWFRPEGPHNVTVNIGEVEEMRMTTPDGVEHIYYMLRKIPTAEHMGPDDYHPYADTAIIVSVDDDPIIEIGQRHKYDVTWDSTTVEDLVRLIVGLVFETEIVTPIGAVAGLVGALSSQ